MGVRHAVVAANRTMFRRKEMCHEEIHHCSRVDLADRDPVAHRDCKRSPRLAVEPGVREQRLLTISGASERFCPRLKIWHSLGGRLATRGSAAVSPHDQSRDAAILLAAMPAAELNRGAVACANERKRGQSKARQIKSRCPGMIT